MDAVGQCIRIFEKDGYKKRIQNFHEGAKEFIFMFVLLLIYLIVLEWRRQVYLWIEGIQ